MEFKSGDIVVVLFLDIPNSSPKIYPLQQPILRFPCPLSPKGKC